MSEIKIGDKITVWQKLENSWAYHIGRVDGFSNYNPEVPKTVRLDIPHFNGFITEFCLDDGWMYVWGQGNEFKTDDWIVDERWLPITPLPEEKADFCPCSGMCCTYPNTYTPQHQCMEDVCEYCFVSECKNCGKSCACDL